MYAVADALSLFIVRHSCNQQKSGDLSEDFPGGGAISIGYSERNDLSGILAVGNNAIQAAPPGTGLAALSIRSTRPAHLAQAHRKNLQRDGVARERVTDRAAGG